MSSDDTNDAPVRTIQVALLLRRAPLDVLLGLVELLTELRCVLANARVQGAGWRCLFCQHPSAEHRKDGYARRCPVHRADVLLGTLEAAVLAEVDLGTMTLEQSAGHAHALEETADAWRRLALARAKMLGNRLVESNDTVTPLEEARVACDDLRGLGIAPSTGEPLAGPGDDAAANGGLSHG